ncbi:MAG: DUF1616 domain-containing protein [Thaumarchaeota archaeon]|nr:DUF1616 domain-containing protein [Nitrososphaerota archaeon]
MKQSRAGKTDQELSDVEERAMKKLAGKELVPLPSLVSDLSKDTGYSADKVTEGLMRLQSRRLVVIAERDPYGSFASYVFSPISLWFWGAACATLLSVVFVFATSGLALYLRYAFGALIILFLPGYSLIELLYYRKELDELTRYALSIGLSLALVPLVGLVLNDTPFGIRLLPVAFTLSGLTLLLLVLALKRKHEYYKTVKAG